MVAEALDGGALLDGAVGGRRARDEEARDRLGIISPFTRHPIQIAMEARVTQEAAGEGRFYLGLGASKIFMKEAGIEGKSVAAMRDAAEIVRGVLGGGELDYAGPVFEAHVPALRDEAETPRWHVPLYFAGTGPLMLKTAAQVADGLLTASITTPPSCDTSASRCRPPDGIRIRSTSAARLLPL